MKNLTLFPMSSYRSKILGLIITFIGLVLLAIVAIHGPIQALHKPTGDKQFDFFMVVLIFGMYITAFSKEKVDDERVHIIRAKAMQMAFGLLVGGIAAISFATSLTPMSTGLDISMLTFFGVYGLGVYLVVFHVGLYFDPSWAYNDDTVIPNIKKNKTFFVIYLSVLIILAALAFILRK